MIKYEVKMKVKSKRKNVWLTSDTNYKASDERKKKRRLECR